MSDSPIGRSHREVMEELARDNLDYETAIRVPMMGKLIERFADQGWILEWIKADGSHFKDSSWYVEIGGADPKDGLTIDFAGKGIRFSTALADCIDNMDRWLEEEGRL